MVREFVGYLHRISCKLPQHPAPPATRAPVTTFPNHTLHHAPWCRSFLRAPRAPQLLPRTPPTLRRRIVSLDGAQTRNRTAALPPRQSSAAQLASNRHDHIDERSPKVTDLCAPIPGPLPTAIPGAARHPRCDNYRLPVTDIAPSHTHHLYLSGRGFLFSLPLSSFSSLRIRFAHTLDVLAPILGQEFSEMCLCLCPCAAPSVSAALGLWRAALLSGTASRRRHGHHFCRLHCTCAGAPTADDVPLPCMRSTCSVQTSTEYRSVSVQR